jgi:TetR/AcrR family transcriptional regulator
VGTPRRLRQIEAKRSAILDAGLRLFSRQGLHGTTIEQIAKAADVSKTNLFYYFATKNDVYVEILRRLLDTWLAPLRDIKADDDPVVAIGDYIKRKVVFSRTNPEASRLFCLELVQGAPLLQDELRHALKILVDEKAEVIRGWIAAGTLAPVDPYHLVFSIWAVTQHYADFAVQVEAITGKTLDDDVYLEETVRNVQALILGGICPRAGE